MVGHWPLYNSTQAGLSGNRLGVFAAPRCALSAHGFGYMITTTTTLWRLPVALRGGGLD
jgi:hypothetical protein